MELYEFAEKLKTSLKENLNITKADEIVARIQNATNNNKPLTKSNINFIKEYFVASGYDPETNKFQYNESENDDFLEYVDYIFAQLGY